MSLLTTTQLIGVVQSLIRPASALLDRYFPTVTTFDTEEVAVDVIPGKRRVAPFVSPVVEGHVVEALGRRVNILKPAYVKPKTPFKPGDALKRAAGEQIGGSLSAQQRFDLSIAQHLADLIGMVTRRKEVMASEALRLGKVTIKGEKYPETLVDFGRAAALTVADLAGTDRWNQAGSKPLTHISDFELLGLQHNGVAPIDAIMGVEAWEWFSENAQVEKRLLQLNAAGTSLDRIMQQQEGLMYKGTIDGKNIFVYAGWYVDPETGLEAEIWPAKALALTGPAIEGEQLHGAIQDPKVGLQGMEYFPKMWDEEDPAVRWLMIQSAPLVAPLRPDAVVYCNNVVG